MKKTANKPKIVQTKISSYFTMGDSGGQSVKPGEVLKSISNLPLQTSRANQPSSNAKRKSPSSSPPSLVESVKRMKSDENDVDAANSDEITLKKAQPVEVCVENLLDDSWEDEGELPLLDLQNPHRCLIKTVERLTSSIKLILTGTGVDKSQAVCVVEGFWCHMKLEPNKTVYVTATYKTDLIAAWHVCNEYGSIVLEPDLLISSTSVVGASFCMRRSVLKELYGGFQTGNRVMIIGALVHQLFQGVLRKKTLERAVIKGMAETIMRRRETVRKMYESEVDADDVMKELCNFVEPIVEFMKRYVCGENGGGMRQRDNWQGKIDDIQDIEENIWCPQLGLKGKVDVTLRSDASTYPLELKTGKATFSIEHRGQIMLYIMMMNQLGYKVSAGLLLYLREGTIREISMSHSEKRDLALLRNELAYFLSKQVGGEFKLELPEPINRNACNTCLYNAVCCAHLRDEIFNLADNNQLGLISERVLAHLQPRHLDYFIKWSWLLRLESTGKEDFKPIKDIYTKSPKEREEIGHCLIGVMIKSVQEVDGLFKHTFGKMEDGGGVLNLQLSGLGMGDYVVVSSDKRPALAAGLLVEIDHNSVVINLERDLRKHSKSSSFHLDTYNSSISQTFNMASLCLLLETSEAASRLRRIVVDQAPPTFSKTIPKAVATKGVSILRTLNKYQKRAVLKALSCNEYVLIKGMPGTGKTATIVALIQILVEIGKTVLITSHTHSAIDNVCLRLQNVGVKLLRIGSDTSIDSKLHQSSEKTLAGHCSTLRDLEDAYNEPQVVGITCLASGHAILNRRKFDVCIVDESTQILQCSLFRAIYASDKFVLVGDPDQLPPIVKNAEALVHGLSETLFDRLNVASATVSLACNYRMNKPITDMANALTYKGELLTASVQVADACLILPRIDEIKVLYSKLPWLLEAVRPSLLASVRVIDTGPVWSLNLDANKETSKIRNKFECAVVVKLTEALVNGGARHNSIGIIAPYRSQVALIISSLNCDEIEVSTVDRYQGRDKEIIVYSCTKSEQLFGADRENNILEDIRRLTVAITRAKHKFILIGDLKTIRNYSPYAKLLDSLDESCFIRLNNDEHGFDWETFMSL